MERLKDKPFALIGINSDSAAGNDLKALFKEHGVTWRNVLAFNTQGPLDKAWGGSGWPRYFVIDRRGVVRHFFRGHDEQALDEALDQLLSEAGGGAGP